jgi:hypothetical protein
MSLLTKSKFLILCIGFGCADSNENSNMSVIPFIEFHQLEIIDIPNSDSYDSLKISFYISDGDFDLGLPSVPAEPYHYRSYFLKLNGQKMSDTKLGSGEVKLDQLISYKDKRLSINDSLPRFVFPFDCTNWHLIKDSNDLSKITDTVYFQYNADFYNFYLDFYQQENDLTWTKFNFNQFKFPNCYPGIHGRFPQLDSNSINYSYSPFQIKKITNNKVLFTFNLSANWFPLIFKEKKIKVKVRVQDRALNKSNEITTSEFQL